jgi:beta-glucosidase
MSKHVASLLAATAVTVLLGNVAHPDQLPLGRRMAPLLHVAGNTFKDLNHNGRLDPYEDWRLPADVRANDLIKRMSLEEKAGLMMHGIPPGRSGSMFAPIDLNAWRRDIAERHVTSFSLRTAGSPRDIAETANAAQAMAEDTRLGIPLTLSSDPRNHFKSTFGTSVDPGRFSLWPEPPGLAAIGDERLVRRFAQVVSLEYRAVGIRMALSPMADLATEPRWSRINGTFGDNIDNTRRFVRAYVEGIQGGTSGIGPNSVASVVKHWVGYGAEPGGYDAHNPYGKELAFPGGDFEDHIQPFRGAFEVHVAGVMPTYAQPPEGLKINGVQAERVGANYSRQMLTDLLRNTYHFDGIVLTDFKVTDDCLVGCMTGTSDINQIGMPWGVEPLSKEERFAKGINAGVDQFGGTSETDVIVRLVRGGRIPIARIDSSVRRLLIQKFALGLFENPYVDLDRANQVVGAPEFVAEGEDAQRRSLVLLENKNDILPLNPVKLKKVWLWKMNPDTARAHGFIVVDRPEKADVAIVHIATPFTPHPPFLFGALLHEGSLSFAPDNPDRNAVDMASSHVPTVVVVYLDRGAILTPIKERASALLAEFGASDAALLDLLTGRVKPQGHLPFELPSSDYAVEHQLPDVPADSRDPLYASGFGRSFSSK